MSRFVPLVRMYRILTHPILSNYGGILQALALQHTISKCDRKAAIVDYLPLWLRSHLRSKGKKEKLRDWILLIRVLLGSATNQLPAYIVQYLFAPFKKVFMHTWQPDMQRKHLLNETDCAYIVGSDQVWRAIYTRAIETAPFFFLDFATEAQRRRSFAYAASFGSEEWEGTPEETTECARLLKDFKAVSVREHSGIRICREVFGVDAVQMPDPTLLLEPEDYSRLIRRWWTRRLAQPSMAVYLLDETDEKKQIFLAAAEQANLYLQHLTPHGDAPKAMDRIPLSIPQWLRCIRDSECVLTDSFHGCVFSIIFNKSFVCLGNDARGSARFDSLLSTFGLQERLLINPSPEQVVKTLRTAIDWERVNNIRSREKQRALQFLKKNIE